MSSDATYRDHIMWCVHPDKTKTFGRLNLPVGCESFMGVVPHATVVLGHGIGGCHQHMAPYAAALADTGVVTYNIDFRGAGELGKSDLDATEMTPATEADDLAFAADLMREEPFCDESSLFLCGGSLGGLAATIEACRRPELYRGLILLYPAFSAHDEALATLPPRDEIPESYVTHHATVGRGFAEHMLDTDPFEFMASYQGPVLIVHGTDDTSVPLSYSERAVETFPNARLEVIEGAGHTFSGEALQRARELVASFVGDVIRGR